MMTRILKHLLVLAGGAVLLAGCATNQGAGGTGSEIETTGPTGPQVISGPNGSISSGNPLGIGGANSAAGWH